MSIETDPRVGLPLRWAAVGQWVWVPIVVGYCRAMVVQSAGHSIAVESKHFNGWVDVRDCMASVIPT